MKKTIICDIDGTIANVQHRLHFIKNEDGTKKKKPDWDSFNAACVDDEPYKDVIEVILNHVECGHRLYFFSGRNDSVWAETVDWLNQHVGEKWWSLQMRGAKDRRPDTVVKLEMMENLLKIQDGLQVSLTPDDVLCIYDDRQSVVDMWRENGFRVMQVDAWKEESVGDHHLSQEKLESLNKAELMFLIEHERKHREMGADSTSEWRGYRVGPRCLVLPRTLEAATDGDLSDVDREVLAVKEHDGDASESEKAQTLQFFEEQAEQAFFEELDELRDSGEINMLGAPRWLVENYGLEKSEAKRIFMAWAEKKEEEG